ncbi:MAG: exopolysaccharide biosynthesis protein [Rhodospirillaceae bacterium]
MSANGSNLENLLDDLSETSKASDEISVGDIQDAVGHRSFAPLLAAFALIVLTPVGGIPGVPTAFGGVVVLLAGQILIGRNSLWLPSFITERAVASEKLQAGIERIRFVASFVDRVLHPRLTVLADGWGTYGIATACIVLAGMLPLLEIVPGAAAVPAIAILMFALALMAKDGLVAAIGYAALFGTVYLVVIWVPFGAVF